MIKITDKKTATDKNTGSKFLGSHYQRDKEGLP